MFILNIFFIIVAAKYSSRELKFRILIYYGIVALFQDVVCTAIILTDYTSFDLGKFGTRLIEANNIIFIQLEFIAFYRFFYLQFDGKPIQNKIKITCALFIIVAAPGSVYFIFFASFHSLHNYSGCLSVTSCLLQIIPAFYYFYTLFRDPPVKNLLRDASFWIVTGIAFFNGLNIPLFLIETYIMDQFTPIYLNLYTINYIAYSFLFVLFIIGLLCDDSMKIRTPKKNVAMDLHKTF